MIATGSEVHLALAAAERLALEGRHVRVVSMPCTERFLLESTAYQEQVLPNARRTRVAIEAAASDYWSRFVGLDGRVIGLNRFGVSAPAEQAYQELGITVEHTIAAITALF